MATNNLKDLSAAVRGLSSYLTRSGNREEEPPVHLQKMRLHKGGAYEGHNIEREDGSESFCGYIKAGEALLVARGIQHGLDLMRERIIRDLWHDITTDPKRKHATTEANLERLRAECERLHIYCGGLEYKLQEGR